MGLNTTWEAGALLIRLLGAPVAPGDEVITCQEELDPPYLAPYARHVYHQYTVRVRAGRREQVRLSLQRQGIATAVYYPVPVHRLSPYQMPDRQLPVAECASKEVLSLPLWPGLDGYVQRHVVKTALEGCVRGS